MLTINLAKGESWTLPWGRFRHAHLDCDKLVLAFAERKILVHDRNLVKLQDNIGRFHLEMRREIPPDYEALADGNKPFISKFDLRRNAT
jgi:hypothetical protein